jgi:hypothetical protein
MLQGDKREERTHKDLQPHSEITDRNREDGESGADNQRAGDDVAVKIRVRMPDQAEGQRNKRHQRILARNGSRLIAVHNSDFHRVAGTAKFPSVGLGDSLDELACGRKMWVASESDSYGVISVLANFAADAKRDQMSIEGERV